MTETFNDAELAAQNQSLKEKVKQLESFLSSLGKSYQAAADAHFRFNHSLKIAMEALDRYRVAQLVVGINDGWAQVAMAEIRKVHKDHEVLTP